MNNLIESILQEINYKQNPYFLGLADGTFSKEDFIETQVQFYFAVVFFSRPMSVLAAKIPDPELRIEILRNVWEEHGEGNTSKMHGVTFTELLKRLGEITVVDIEKRSLSPAVRIFNTTLIGACTLDDYLVGVATLGMIERMFCDISNIIAEGIVARGWLTADTMIHYNLHKDLDVKHSQDFFNVLQNSWNESPKNKYLIEQGLRMGAVLFNDLYLGLFQSKKQRRMVPSGFFKESQ